MTEGVSWWSKAYSHVIWRSGEHKFKINPRPLIGQFLPLCSVRLRLNYILSESLPMPSTWSLELVRPARGIAGVGPCARAGLMLVRPEVTLTTCTWVSETQSGIARPRGL